MAVRCTLVFAVFQLAIINCCAISGIIWRKQEQKFVQLFNVPQFAALQRENHRALEKHNFNKEVVKAVYYQEKNMVMFYDNDTKITGICGELWHLLADYLNFTLVPLKSIDRNFGDQIGNGSYSGLVGMLLRNEAQVILRSAFLSTRNEYVDYTTPIWKSKFRIYVRPEQLYDNKWIFTLFSPMTWYSVFFLFIILSLVGYFLQKIPTEHNFKRKRKGLTDFSLGDHIFYSFAMMCAQGYIPTTFYNKFKILSLSKSIFAWLVLLAYSSHLIYRMTNRITRLPFKDLDTLFNDTKYILLAFHDSFFYNSFDHENDTRLSRIHFVTVPDEMHKKTCHNFKKFAMFEIEDRFMALNRHNCPLQGTGNFNETWITFAIRKRFRYKRTIDVALIKFSEVGLMDVLRDRWLDIRLDNKEQNTFKMIDLYQVYLIFLIFCFSCLISFAIFILEHIVHFYETRGSKI